MFEPRRAWLIGITLYALFRHADGFSNFVVGAEGQFLYLLDVGLYCFGHCGVVLSQGLGIPIAQRQEQRCGMHATCAVKRHVFIAYFLTLLLGEQVRLQYFAQHHVEQIVGIQDRGGLFVEQQGIILRFDAVQCLALFQ